MRYSKPNKWAFDQGFTHPKWDPLWRSAVHVLPFWEGGGQPQDLVKSGTTFTFGANAEYGPGPGGIEVDLDGAAGDYVIFDNIGLARTLQTHTATFVFVSGSSGAQSLWGEFNAGTTTGAQVQINTDQNGVNVAGKINTFVRDDSGTARNAANSTVVSSINDGVEHIVTCIHNGNTFNIVIDGMDEALTFGSSGTPTNFTSDFDFNPTIGARNVRGTISEQMVGGLLMAAFHSEALDVNQVIDWHKDIYDFIRMDDEVFGRVPVVGGANPKGPFGMPFHGPFGGPLSV